MSQRGHRQSRSSGHALTSATPLALALICAAIFGSTAAAQEEARPKPSTSVARPPMPPLRPQQFAAPTALPASPAVVTPPGVDPMVANFAPDMPLELPAASRARMHKCGAEWQKMKESGAAAEKTWLDFARICLTH